MLKFSIIIPACDNNDYTQACVDSIKEQGGDYEIIIVDNGSKKAQPIVDWNIINQKNVGFPKAVNQGIKRAAGEIIVLLNNDTIVSPNWLENLEKHLLNYDVVTPVSDNIGGVQCVQVGDIVDNFDFYNKAIKLNIENKGNSMPHDRLVFFCVAIKRSVVNKIGLLDEDFSPGNYEDNDYCLRAIQSGFRCGIALDVLIHHARSITHKSLNIDYLNLLKTNDAKFHKKWGRTRQIVLAELNVRNCQPIDNQNMPTLALVMIVKNEEKGLANAILSARGIVDHVCVSVDESSSDNTLEVAKLWADEVKTHKWADDFSGARNEAHKGIQTDYIMFLDGHEYIKNGQKIKEHLKTGGDGFLCTVEMENDLVFRNPRIYKNGIQFDGKVHEMQANMSPKRAFDVIIKHDRINGQDKKSADLRDLQREEQIVRIMGGQLKKDPKNAHAAFHLALHYQTQSQWKKTIKMQKHFLKISKIKCERWYVYFNMAFCYLALGKNYMAWHAAGCAEAETPKRWETAKLRGLILINQKNYKGAAEYFVDSLGSNNADEAYKPWGREIFSTWNLIGECLFNQGMYWQAGEAFRKAGENSKDPEFNLLMKRRYDLMFEIAKSAKNIALYTY